jgi:hypothetical protein
MCLLHVLPLPSPTGFPGSHRLSNNAAMKSDKQVAKWRAEFERIGREAVRHKLHTGGWRSRHIAAAEQWLREQEAAEDFANKRVRVATIAAAVIGLAGVVIAWVLGLWEGRNGVSSSATSSSKVMVVLVF